MTDTAYTTAKKRVEDRLTLVVHIVVFAAVNIGLFIANGGVDLTAGHFWGWGIGLAVHVIYVVASGGQGVVDRMVEREAARQR